MPQVDMHALAARSAFNSFHWKVLLWCVLILIIDGYDLAVVGAALPSIMKDMGVAPTQAGIMAGSALFGTMLGAIFLGSLADRIGRPRMISICVVLFSLFTAGAGLTSDPWSFSASRFIAGLGIGGVLPAMTAQMAEFAPASMRTRLVTIVFAGYSVGGILVALTAKQLIESHGWSSVFYVAGLPVLLIPFILRFMQESIGYLVKSGRQVELRSLAQRLAPEERWTDPATEFVIAASEASTRGTVPQLFQQGRSVSTVMIWLAFMTGLFMVYALNSWLTKLMAMAGHSLGSALNFVIVFNTGSIVGAILGGYLSDRMNIKRVLISFYVLGALSLTVLGYTSSTAMLFVVVFVVGASTLGTQLIAYAYAGIFYPPSLRSAGVGFASGIGRIGAIVAPVLIGWLVSLNLPLERNFLSIAMAGLVGALAVAMVNHSTSHSSASRRKALHTDGLRRNAQA